MQRLSLGLEPLLICRKCSPAKCLPCVGLQALVTGTQGPGCAGRAGLGVGCVLFSGDSVPG